MAVAARLPGCRRRSGLWCLTSWACLAGRALLAERDAHPGGWLPLALRAAPEPDPAADGLDALLCVLTTPIRSGFILTRRRLAAGATPRVRATGSANGASPCGPCSNRLRPAP